MNLFIRSAAAALALASTVGSSTSAFAYDRSVAIVNEGRGSIHSVRISHVGDAIFGRDLLNDQVIPAGYNMTVEPDVSQGYCRFDVQITYTSGRKVTEYAVNLCTVSQIVVTERGAWTI